MSACTDNGANLCGCKNKIRVWDSWVCDSDPLYVYTKVPVFMQAKRLRSRAHGRGIPCLSPQLHDTSCWQGQGGRLGKSRMATPGYYLRLLSPTIDPATGAHLPRPAAQRYTQPPGSQVPGKTPIHAPFDLLEGPLLSVHDLECWRRSLQMRGLGSMITARTREPQVQTRMDTTGRSTVNTATWPLIFRTLGKEHFNERSIEHNVMISNKHGTEAAYIT